MHPADEVHDVAGVRRDAVAPHPDLRAPAAQPDVPPGEVIRSGRRLDRDALAVDIVDLQGAAVLGRSECWC